MQSQLTPSVTPRPVKKGINTTNSNNGPGKQLGSPASRAGRTYTPSVSPIKALLPNPFSCKDPGTKAENELGLRQAEVPSPPKFPSPTGGLRKKPIILSGDIRNLDSNFDISTSKVQVTLPHVVSAFARYGIAISSDDAQTLLYEYDENNDTGLAYDAFVDDLVQLLRQTALNKTGTSRTQIKKIRLTHHLDKLSIMHAHIVHQLQTLLSEKLCVSWATVRDTFRAADPGHKGQLPKHVFANLCCQLQIPVPSTVLEGLVLRVDPRSNGVVDYNDFLAYFGTDFQHSDPNSVSTSLTFERGIIAGKGAVYGIDTNGAHAVVSNTLLSPGVSSALGGKSKKATTASSPSSPSRTDPLYMEQLRIVLNEKIASRYSDVKKAFLALDKDGNGRMSAMEFARVLQNFNLVVSQEETDALMAHFDANGDGSIDYAEFFAQCGDAIKPSAMTTLHKNLQENSSLIFSGQRDVKGTNRNRLALSSPGNELKEAFSRLGDDSWRAMFVELEMSDPRKTGLVTSAELLRVLGKHLGELPKKSFGVLFRTCGSHVNQFMNYRTLVHSYRPSVLDAVEFFQQDVHARADKTFRKSPTESLVMVWSIRVQRAQLSASEWQGVKEAIWRADARRQGRVLGSEFKPIVQQLLKLSEDQMAFLCFFYEDKNLSSDQVLIRYSSFLTDYEDPGLEASSGAGVDQQGSPSRKKNGNRPRVEGKGRPRPPHDNSGPPAAVAFTDADRMEREQEEKQLRDFFLVNVRSLETLLAAEDADKKGFVALEMFHKLCKELNSGKWKETDVSATFFAKYVSQSQLFYYRGFLLDFDQKAGLQTQALVLQDDDDEADGDEIGDRYDEEGHVTSHLHMDVHQARDAMRHRLTSSMGKQKAVYKLFQRLDPGKSGLLAYPELRRALERLEICVDDATARELLAHFEDEDEQGNRIGRVKYLQFLHALGGRDPDKLDGMSDLSSNCSYYSAISISPRPAMRGGGMGARSSLMSRNHPHVAAAHAVTNAIEKPRNSSGLNSSGAAAAATVERKIQTQLEAQGKGKWKQVARAFQQLDSDRRGSVQASSFRKVLEEFGVLLDQEEVVRLQLKYDVEQNGRIHYHEYLRHLTNSMSDLSGASGGATGNAELLPSLGSSGGMAASPRRTNGGGNAGHSASGSASTTGSGIPDALRQGVKSKWKAIYSSFKTLDKQNIGRVSAAHFRQLLEWYALPVADEAFLGLLRQFDHDADACVDYSRFMRACFG